MKREVSNVNTEETYQVVDKTRFIVVSNYKSAGETPQDKIVKLLHREVEESTITEDHTKKQ